MEPRGIATTSLKTETENVFRSAVYVSHHPTTLEQDTFPVNILLLIG
jgi:hypothetical protein